MRERGVYRSREGLDQSSQPAGTMVLSMYVYRKTTREYGPHARPKNTCPVPVPVSLQLMNTKPVFSSELDLF